MDFFVWQRTCVDDAGNVLASASVTVTDAVSGALAQLYADPAGSVGIGNPITADSEGFVQFYVKSGFYNITATSGSRSRTWTREAIGAPHPRTAAEISAGVTPVDYAFQPAFVSRYSESDRATQDVVALSQIGDVRDWWHILEYGQRIEAIYTAEWIRRHAGIPSGVEVGVRSGKSPGVSGTLTNTSRVSIKERSDISSIADSGTGTQFDPYVLDSRVFDNSEASALAGGFYWEDPDADYFIKLRNCEISGYATAQVVMQAGEWDSDAAFRLTLENCKIHSSTTQLISVRMGSVLCDQVHFAGGSVGIQCINVNLSPGERLTNARVKLVDCLVDDAENAWVSEKRFWWNARGCESVEFVHCDFNSPSLSTYFYHPAPGRFQFLYCDFTNGEMHIASTNNNMGEYVMGPHRIAYCRFGTVNDPADSNVRSQLELAGFDGVTIEHCEFLDCPDNYRQCLFDNNVGLELGVRNGLVRWCKFTKTTGSGANNECLECLKFSENIVFEYCWVTEAAEDAFEAVDARNVTMRYLVGDNVTGQICDFYGPDGHGGHAHHIYGDCGDVAVLVTDYNDVHVHHVFAESAKASVEIEQRFATAGAGPNNTLVTGPLPLTKSSGTATPYSTKGTIGSNNRAIYLKDGKLVTSGFAAEDAAKHVIR